VPVITPVDHEDRVDEAAYRRQLRRLIKAGVHGIFAGGSAGEGPLLVQKEWERMVAIAFEECHGKTHLLGGAMETSTRRILERVKILAQIGYDKFVVSPTYYVGSKLAGEHLRLFGACKEQSEGMELIVYNIPSCTGSTIRVDTICEMARQGWIRYCKESSEDMDYFRDLVAKGGPLGLRVLMGSERRAAEGLLLGAWGIVPVCANYEPSTYIAAYESRQDSPKLMAAQERINALVQNLALGPRMWLAGVKYAVSKTQGGSGRPVSPLEPLDESEQRRIDAFLSAE
jgi:4-hydroxy-tetrahydrodipicolinate synthase